MTMGTHQGHSLMYASASLLYTTPSVPTGDNEAEVEALAGVIYFASPGFLTLQQEPSYPNAYVAMKYNMCCWVNLHILTSIFPMKG